MSRHQWRSSAPGMTLVEVLIVIAIIGLLMGLLLPAVQSARESARRSVCAGNLKQIGVAFQQHLSAHGHLPFLRGISNHGGPTPCFPRSNSAADVAAWREAWNVGPGENPCSRASSPRGNEQTISGFVYLVPYLDQMPLWDVINAPGTFGGVAHMPFGPPRDFGYYPPWQAKLPVFECPTAPQGLAYHGASSTFRGRRHYAMSLGDRIANNDGGGLPRGLFGVGSRVTQAHVLDGMSFTIMAAERANAVDSSDIRGLAANNQAGMDNNPSLCLATASGGRYLPGVSVQDQRVLGSLWHNGSAPFGGFNTVLPPNSPTCIFGNWDQGSGLISASTYHSGGSMNVLMADGAIRTVNETIDVGDITRTDNPNATDAWNKSLKPYTGPSPYGVWGALGTMRGQEGLGDTW